MATVPIVLAGAMTVSLNLAAPVDSASARSETAESAEERVGQDAARDPTHLGQEQCIGRRDPDQLHRRSGDNVSSIAGR